MKCDIYDTLLCHHFQKHPDFKSKETCHYQASHGVECLSRFALKVDMVPFDTENRPSILDKCARCGHLFKDHNLRCSECDCEGFMIKRS